MGRFATPRLRRNLGIVIILWLAFFLRTYQLTNVPPGLTHDEANHGREAIGVLDGELLFYFPLNYGSEPIYSYTVAGSMGLLGENLFALRWVNVVFGLLAIAATYRLSKYLFDEQIATITAVLIAVSFWPLASSREALRAGMLPFFMVGAVWFYWQTTHEKKGRHTVGFGLCVAITLHIYLAARVAWLIFPLFLLYLALLHRQQFWQQWQRTLWGIGLAGLLVAPLFIYLENHPEALTRLDMLDAPLQNLREGQVGPLLQTSGNALLAFFWPGRGDQFLAYNIPGRPTLDVITAAFFLLGVLICLWHWRHPPYTFLLLWFGVGILPSLITGPTANTTRNLAALPAVYSLPAIGFMGAATYLRQRWPKLKQQQAALVLFLWLTVVTTITFRDYFVRWANTTTVRGAYQHTLVEALDYLQTSITADTIILSTVYPGPAHDSSIGLVLAADAPWQSRWIDARYALILPANTQPEFVVLQSTPIHPLFEAWLQPINTINLRSDDLDPSFTHYRFDNDAFETWLATTNTELINFDDTVHLLHASWRSNTISVGQTAELLTVWRVIDPTRVGVPIPPSFTSDAALFTHVLKSDGSILAQRDSLEAPTWHWQQNDLVIQIHPVTIPAGTPVGTYETAVGLYDRSTGVRPFVVTETGQREETRVFVTPLTVQD